MQHCRLSELEISQNKGHFCHRRTPSSDLHCNDRQCLTANTADDKNTNSSHFTEHCKILLDVSLRKEVRRYFFFEESVEDLQDIADDHVVSLATERL